MEDTKIDKCEHDCVAKRDPELSAADSAKLAQKLVMAMKLIKNVARDGMNTQQKYKYASSDAVLMKVQDAFVKAGLATVVDQIEIITEWQKETASGAMWNYVKMKIGIRLVDSETGAFIYTYGIGVGADPGDKADLKAQTVARKYALLLALNISTGDDPEADERIDKEEFVKEKPLAANEAKHPWCGGIGTKLDNGAYRCARCNEVFVAT